MSEILELVRIPVVACILATVVGIGLGLGFDEKSRSRGAVPIIAAVAASLLIAQAVPDAPLVTPVLTLGFAVTVIVRRCRATRRPHAGSAN